MNVVTSFDGNGQDPHHPTEGVTLSGNTLYGATSGGGANRSGTLFSLPFAGGSPTVLTSFDGSTGPPGGLTLLGNALYGATYGGGANGVGTVFSVPVTGGSPTVLASFNDTYPSFNGASSEANLIVSGKTLYGTTVFGGDYGAGTVFSVPVTGGTSTVLASFNGSNGDSPEGGPIHSKVQGRGFRNGDARRRLFARLHFTSSMFHRLFGDVQNTDNLNNFDLTDLSRGFRNVANLSPDLYFNGNGQADNLDLGAFRRNFAKSFSGPLGT